MRGFSDTKVAAVWVAASVVIALFLVGGAPAAAQGITQINLEQGLLEEIERLRKQGIVIPRDQVDEMLQRAREGQSSVVEPSEVIDREWFEQGGAGGAGAFFGKPLSTVVGKEGIPFPKEENIVQRPLPNPDPSQDVLPTPEPEATPKPLKLPGLCQKNETTREVRHPELQEDLLVADILFIPKQLIPLDPTEVFGTEVSLIPYTSEEGDEGLMRAALIDVPCVPYRLRITNVAAYSDTGINAYKNHGAKQDSAGTLHPVMQDKLFGSKSASKKRR